MITSPRRFLPPLLAGTALCFSGVRVAHAGQFVARPGDGNVRATLFGLNTGRPDDPNINNVAGQQEMTDDKIINPPVTINYHFDWESTFGDRPGPITGRHKYTLGGSLEAEATGNSVAEANVTLSAHTTHPFKVKADHNDHHATTPIEATDGEEEALGVIRHSQDEQGDIWVDYLITLGGSGHASFSYTGKEYGHAGGNNVDLGAAPSITSVRVILDVAPPAPVGGGGDLPGHGGPAG